MPGSLFVAIPRTVGISNPEGASQIQYNKLEGKVKHHASLPLLDRQGVRRRELSGLPSHHNRHLRSHGGVATIDGQGDAGDIIGGAAGEENCGAGEFVRLTPASMWNT